MFAQKVNSVPTVCFIGVVGPPYFSNVIRNIMWNNSLVSDANMIVFLETLAEGSLRSPSSRYFEADCKKNIEVIILPHLYYNFICLSLRAKQNNILPMYLTK